MIDLRTGICDGKGATMYTGDGLFHCDNPDECLRCPENVAGTFHCPEHTFCRVLLGDGDPPDPEVTPAA